MIHLTRRGKFAVLSSFAIGYIAAGFISYRSAQADAKFYEGLSSNLPVFANPGEAKVYKSSFLPVAQLAERLPKKGGRDAGSEPARKTIFKRTFSVYHWKYIGRNMANGQPYRETGYTVASNDWPLGTRLILRVGKRIEYVTVSDRMATKFTGVRVDLSHHVWDVMSGGAEPSLLKGTVEVQK